MIEIDFFLNHVRNFRLMTGLSLDAGADANHALHLSLLVEEMDEFLAADTLADRADALADTVTVACGYLLDAGDHCRADVLRIVENCQRTADAWGIDLPGAFLLVHESNMSKLVLGDAELRATLAKYDAEGVGLDVRHVGEQLGIPVMAVYAAQDGRYPRGKLLKGATYHQPAWDRVGVWQR